MALCAVVLLALAQVRSNVMRVAELAPEPGCGMGAASSSMPGMAGAGVHREAPGVDGKGRPTCAYCADAAHAPLPTAAIRLPAPSCVRWSATPARYAPLPRGPPPIEARARGPPEPPLTA